MSGVARAVKKVFKGVGKIVKKVVSGVVKLGKKIVQGVGKFMGKIGPIGTIAIGFLAPYAIGAMASSSIGWVSSIGKGLQAVGGLIKAPFQAAGQVLGKGVDFLGKGASSLFGGVDTMVGRGVGTLTDKITNFLGYNGGSVSENVKGIFSDSMTKFDEAFKTNFSGTTGYAEMSPFGVSEGTMDALRSVDGATVSADSDVFKTLIEEEMDFAPPGYRPTGFYEGSAQHEALLTQEKGTGFGSEPLFGRQQLASETLDALEDPFVRNVEAAGYDVPDREEGFTSKASKALKSAFSGFASPSLQDSAWAGMSDPGSAYQGPLASAEAGGFGAGARSFYAQDRTGLMSSEDYAERAYNLLGSRRRVG